MNLSLSEAADEVSIDTALYELLFRFTDRRPKVLRGALVRCRVPKPGLDLYKTDPSPSVLKLQRNITPSPYTHTTTSYIPWSLWMWLQLGKENLQPTRHPVPIPLNTLSVDMPDQARGRASHSGFDSCTITGRWQLPPREHCLAQQPYWLTLQGKSAGCCLPDARSVGLGVPLRQGCIDLWGCY